ncbi:MAG: acetolactate decarboxylase [Streptococcaceae bacterium]|nr:acetolactate decarboxylase [Streptococcaceae bacterium]
MKLYQHSTLLALMGGLYEGTLKLNELMKHGNSGIGTLDDIDGELIIIDGQAFQARSNNTVIELTGDELVPYGAVVTHHPTHQFKMTNTTDQKINQQIIEQMNGENLFYSIKMSGTFKKMHVRMVPKQERPYSKAFVEIAANQPEYTKENIRGSIVGIFTPALFHGVSVEGFHLHFLDDSHQFGGHVIDYVADEVDVELGQIEELVQHFPTRSKRFIETNLDIEKLKNDIHLSE